MTVGAQIMRFAEYGHVVYGKVHRVHLMEEQRRCSACGCRPGHRFLADEHRKNEHGR